MAENTGKWEEACEKIRAAYEQLEYSAEEKKQDIKNRILNVYKDELQELLDAEDLLRNVSQSRNLSARQQEAKHFLEKNENVRAWLKENKADFDSDGWKDLGDATISEQQRKGLNACRQWLLRHADHGSGSRELINRFLMMDERQQLKALYLVETKKRKNPDPKSDDVLSQLEYIPNLETFKDRMTRTKFSVLSRLGDGKYFWHKLGEGMRLSDEPDTITAIETLRTNLQDAGIQSGTGVLKSDESRTKAEIEAEYDTIARSNPAGTELAKAALKRDLALTALHFEKEETEAIDAIQGGADVFAGDYVDSFDQGKMVTDGIANTVSVTNEAGVGELYGLNAGAAGETITSAAEGGIGIAVAAAGITGGIKDTLELKENFRVLDKTEVAAGVSAIGKDAVDIGNGVVDAVKSFASFSEGVGQLFEQCSLGLAAVSGGITFGIDAVNTYKASRQQKKAGILKNVMTNLSKSLEKVIHGLNPGDQTKKELETAKLGFDQLSKLAKLSEHDAERRKKEGRRGCWLNGAITVLSTVAFGLSLANVIPGIGNIAAGVGALLFTAGGALRNYLDKKERKADMEYIKAELGETEFNKKLDDYTTELKKKNTELEKEIEEKRKRGADKKTVKELEKKKKELDRLLKDPVKRELKVLEAEAGRNNCRTITEYANLLRLRDREKVYDALYMDQNGKMKEKAQAVKEQAGRKLTDLKKLELKDSPEEKLTDKVKSILAVGRKAFLTSAGYQVKFHTNKEKNLRKSDIGKRL